MEPESLACGNLSPSATSAAPVRAGRRDGARDERHRLRDPTRPVRRRSPRHVSGHARRPGAPGGRGRRRDAVHPPPAGRAACAGELGAGARPLKPLPVRSRRSGRVVDHRRAAADLREDILVPDLAGWRREQMPDYPDTAYFTLAGEWLCEVLSAYTHPLDLHGKRPVYAGVQVSHLWLVDTADPTLEAFELRDKQWVSIVSARDDDPVCIPPFDAATFKPRRSVDLRRRPGRYACPGARPRASAAWPKWGSIGSNAGTFPVGVEPIPPHPRGSVQVGRSCSTPPSPYPTPRARPATTGHPVSCLLPFPEQNLYRICLAP